MTKVGKWLKRKNLEKITELATKKENTIAIIAKQMNIHPATFYRWLEQYEEISEAFENGRRCIDEEVESSFFRMCTGYKETVSEEKVIDGEVVELKKEIYIPPSVPAMTFYLQNRLPDKWRPTKAIIFGGDDGDDGNTGVVILAEVIEDVESAEFTEGADNSDG